MTDERKVCFVVMGFGKKTDYESRRTLDLDATYEAIIQPAVEDNGYKCVRANNELHSGIVDVAMYKNLLNADLVVADISTGNANAIYELGVRHALRSRPTIVMKEKLSLLQFNLNHVSIFPYEHLGEDIGSREANRARAELGKLIAAVSESDEPDSPVYTYIRNLMEPLLLGGEGLGIALESAEETQQPICTFIPRKEELEEMLEGAEEAQQTFAALIDEAKAAAKDSNHEVAAAKFRAAMEMSDGNAYLRQQTALHTYKSEQPSELSALREATLILAPLDPDSSNDPETLGLSGAIHKRLWQHTNDRATLDLAIQYYRKGFDLLGDHYNGENAATCLELRSALQDDRDEELYDRMSAIKIRGAVTENLMELVSDESFGERPEPDQKWIFATLANCLFALSRPREAKEFEARFLKLHEAAWEKETYYAGKRTLFEFHGLEE